MARRRQFASRLLGSATPATLRVLDLLHDGGARLALLSNATSEVAEAWPSCELATRFKVTVFSCELGVAKPDREIYLAATQRLGADPANCVYVGDGADQELSTAVALGMTAIRTTEHNDTDPYWAGIGITALTEIPALLPIAPGRQDSERSSSLASRAAAASNSV